MSNKKQTFNFSVDRKVSIWRKEFYEINANSYEEAVKQMKEEMNTPVYEERWFYSNEFDFETEQELTPADNEWYATVMLMDRNGNMNEEIASNVD